MSLRKYLKTRRIAQPMIRRRQQREFAAQTQKLLDVPFLSDVVAATLNGQLSDKEAFAVSAIEEIRASLFASPDKVSYIDYGAGASKDAQDEDNKAKAGANKAQLVRDICVSNSKPPIWGLFLFHLVRKIGSVNCVEMGCCLGMSAAYIATALQLNGKGRLITLEGAESFADIARKNLRQLGLDNAEIKVGQFDDTLAQALREMESVSFIFVDGHHEEMATQAYFETIKPFLENNALVIFDDIHWSEGMERAWESVSSCCESYDLGKMGLCIHKQ